MNGKSTDNLIQLRDNFREKKQDRKHVTRKITETIINDLPDSLKDLQSKDYADKDGYADILGEIFTKNVKTNQLRRFFDAMKQIESKLFAQRRDWKDIENEFYLLKPKLAFAKGRKLIPDIFYDLIMACMGKTNSKEDFKVLVQFFEAIVAYHRYYGGE
ncbi:MAG: type III-A CRISPR-associated protein Csm2 [Methanosarcinales archaeon]